MSSFVENAPLTIEVIPFCFSYLRMALAMHIQILQERRFSSSQPMMSSKEVQQMVLYLAIHTTTAFTGIGAVYVDRLFFSGAMILYQYLAAPLKGIADQC
jgi:hypothetical protein